MLTLLSYYLIPINFIPKRLFQSLPRGESHQFWHLVHLQFADRSYHVGSDLAMAALLIFGMQVRMHNCCIERGHLIEVDVLKIETFRAVIFSQF